MFTLVVIVKQSLGRVRGVATVRQQCTVALCSAMNQTKCKNEKIFKPDPRGVTPPPLEGFKGTRHAATGTQMRSGSFLHSKVFKTNPRISNIHPADIKAELGTQWSLAILSIPTTQWVTTSSGVQSQRDLVNPFGAYLHGARGQEATAQQTSNLRLWHGAQLGALQAISNTSSQTS